MAGCILQIPRRSASGEELMAAMSLKEKMHETQLQSAADAKVADIQHQIEACMRGATDVLVCPYCHIGNFKGEPKFCCTLLAKAVKAVLHRQDAAVQLAKTERVMEAVAQGSFTEQQAAQIEQLLGVYDYAVRD